MQQELWVFPAYGLASLVLEWSPTPRRASSATSRASRDDSRSRAAMRAVLSCSFDRCSREAISCCSLRFASWAASAGCIGVDAASGSRDAVVVSADGWLLLPLPFPTILCAAAAAGAATAAPGDQRLIVEALALTVDVSSRLLCGPGELLRRSSSIEGVVEAGALVLAAAAAGAAGASTAAPGDQRLSVEPLVIEALGVAGAFIMS